MAFERVEEFFNKNPSFDCVLLASWDAASAVDANFFYYSGIEVDRATLIARRDAAPLMIANKLNFDMAVDEFSGEVVEFKHGDYSGLLKKHLAGSKKIAVPKSSITASLYEKAVAAAPKAELADASREFLSQRAKKSEDEIGAIRQAAAIARKAFSTLEVKAGMTELEVQAQIHSLTYSCGGEPSFKAIVACGENARFPHAHSGERKVKDGEIVLIDWGAKWKHYCSDHTRCVFAGTPNGEQQAAYEKLRETFEEVLPLLTPGVSAKAVAKQYVEILKGKCLAPPPHNLGHGIGLEVHESPSFSENAEDVILENCVAAIEPSTYCRKFGARFEDTVVVGRAASVI